jgi:hypothetical protein
MKSVPPQISAEVIHRLGSGAENRMMWIQEVNEDVFKGENAFALRFC